MFLASVSCMLVVSVSMSKFLCVRMYLEHCMIVTVCVFKRDGDMQCNIIELCIVLGHKTRVKIISHVQAATGTLYITITGGQPI